MTELRMTRELKAAPERVWGAFTSATGLAGWMWPPAWQTTAEVDLRVGGRFRIASEVAGMAVSGEFVSVEEPTRLVQTWQWDGDTEQTLVTMTLEPSGAGTILTIVHERFGTDENRDHHLQGWNDCVDRLDPYLAA